ncbi:MAG: 7TM diverse intracellular signaling domain-containing protein [Cytophagaceae bacterium]
MRKNLQVLVALIYLLPGSSCLALDTLVISGNNLYYDITGEDLGIFEDKEGKLSPGQIGSPSFLPKFYTSPHGVNFHLSNTGSVYWLRFQIRMENPYTHKWVLENQDQHIDHFELFMQDHGKMIPMKTAGYAMPFEIREYSHKNFVFDLPLDSTTRVFYARVRSSHHNAILLKVRSNRYFTYYALNEYYLLGIFYGILIIMAVYNLLIFLSVREASYIYYVVYVLCCGLISLAEDGTGFQYLWPSFPQLNIIVSASSPMLLIVSFSLYSKVFLRLKEHLPGWNLVLDIIVGIYVIWYFLNLLVIRGEYTFPFYILPFSLIYISAVLCLRKGFKPARYFLIGYSFMFMSIIFLLFRMVGISWDNMLILYSFNIGLVFEIVILSFALGDRIRIIKAEREIALIEKQEAQAKVIEQLRENEKLKDKINRELEDKVAERTYELVEKNQELEIANEKLSYQAEEIQRMNQLLDQENTNLKTNVKELTKARVLMREVDFNEFGKIFPDKESCFKYLSELKWKDGYACKKCGNTKFSEDKATLARRCTKCRYVESPTAYTIFHKLKFDVNKAFYMLFLVYANKEKITDLELSEILSLRQKTCWKFHKKINEAIASKKKPASGDADGWSMLIMDEENE